MQPITNRLCKEYGLSIVPAEYVKEPKNLSRKEWEREQCFRKMILADAEFCQSQAGSFDHFIFLMKRIGYQFEYGKYLSVKVPGGKWYHELDKLDERFSEEKFRFYLDMPFTRPVFVVGNTVAIHKRGITDFQMKYYRRIYQARMVEQRRFDKHSAYLAKELERMNQLQEQYLFLVNNNIKTVEGLVTYQVLGERDVDKISERQQELYQQNRARKRICKTEEDIRDYQIPHGQSNQLMFKDVMKMYKKIKPTGRINDLEAVIAESLSVAPENALEELYALMDKVLKSAPLEEFGVKKSDLAIFAGDVIKTQQRLLRNNYVQLSEEQILEIYEAAY